MLVTPGTAQVTLDGQSISSGVPLRLPPGTYEIRVEADGYLTTTTTTKLGISQIVNLPVELRLIPAAQTMIGGLAYPVMTPDRESIMYLGQSGKQFLKVATDLGSDGTAQVTAISAERFSDIARVVWSPDRTLAIMQKTSGATSLFDFKRYDFLTQEERALENNLRSVTWHPADPLIIGFRSTPDGERSLISQHITSGKVERLIDLRSQGFVDPQLSWSPDGRTVAIVENRIVLYTVATRTLTTLGNSEGTDSVLWSPTSQLLLRADGDQVSLIGVDSDQTFADETIRTSISKVTWTPDGQSIIVAERTDQGKDQFRTINVNTGDSQLYAYTSDHPISAENLLTNADATELWFTTDGSLNNLILELAELEITND